MIVCCSYIPILLKRHMENASSSVGSEIIQRVMWLIKFLIELLSLRVKYRKCQYSQ